MTRRFNPGETINLNSRLYSKLVFSPKGYCLYAYLNEYSLPKVCLNKGNGVVDCFPCYYIRTDDKYLPTLIFVIRNIKGEDAVVLMKDNDDFYNRSRLLYTIELDEFIEKFNAIKEVSTINMTCTFFFPSKYEPYLNDEISEYINRLPKYITQFHPIINDDTFLQPHWYTRYCCWKSRRGYTHEPKTCRDDKAILRDQTDKVMNEIANEVEIERRKKNKTHRNAYKTETEIYVPLLNESSINQPNNHSEHISEPISPIRDISPKKYYKHFMSGAFGDNHFMTGDFVYKPNDSSDDLPLTETEIDPTISSVSFINSPFNQASRGSVKKRTKSNQGTNSSSHPASVGKKIDVTDSSIIYL